MALLEMFDSKCLVYANELTIMKEHPTHWFATVSVLLVSSKV